jgi:hypothetical protein
MTNKAKAASEKNGYKYLRDVLLGVSEQTSSALQHQSTSQTHDGSLGTGCEILWRELLRKYLPTRYQVEEAFVIDSFGRTSDQMDVVIFDSMYTSPLNGHDNTKYIPRESVYAVFEAKQAVSKQHLGYAGQKAASVNALHCTSASIVNAGNQSGPRDIFRPLTGLIAFNAQWKDGLASKSFIPNLPSAENSRLDFVLTAKSGFYDGRPGVESPLALDEGAMMTGIFRLLQALQELGTVPAIDWSVYERVMKLGKS